MNVSSRRRAIVAALLVALAGCDGDGGDDGDATDGSPSAGSGSTPAEGAEILDRLIADADAYRFVGGLLREDAGFSREGDAFDGAFITDVFAGFERATDGDGDMASLLAEFRVALREQATVGCEINGTYDGVRFDDTPDEDDGDSAFSEFVSAGELLALSDETRSLGALRSDPVDTADGPFYAWDAPDGLDRTTIGTLNIDVPGDVFPGVGTLIVPATPLVGLHIDTPRNLESVVRWEPLDGSGTVVVGLDISGDGDDFVGIACTTADDGEFRVPEATAARLPESLDGSIDLYVERSRFDIVPMGEAIIASNRTTIRLLLAGD